MRRIFMDNNVVIDFLANRQPFALHAAQLFELSLAKKVKIYISAISYNNIYNVLRQSLSHTNAIKLIESLADMTEITDVTGSIIRESIRAGFKDYEDAIQYQCALSIPDIDFIVTRNVKDFKKSKLSLLSPIEAMASLTL